MTQGKTNPSPARQTSLRGRIMRIVAPVVMVTFLLIGVMLALYLQTQAHDRQVSAQQNTLANAGLRLDTLVENITSDVRGLAESRSAREFARDTQIVVSNAAIADTQNRLLRDMSSLLEQNIGTYLSTRYITYTGSIWSEVTNIDSTIPMTDGAVRLNTLNDDGLLQQSLMSPFGTVLGGELDFTESSVGTLLPFFRFMSSVAAENDATNLAGAVEVDVMISPLVEMMQDLAANADAFPGRRFILTDMEGRVLLDTASAELDLYAIGRGQPVLLSDISQQLASAVSQNSTELSAHAVGSDVASSVFISLPGGSQTLFHLYLLDPAAIFSESVPQTALIVFSSLLIGALLCVIIYAVLGNLLEPIHDLAQEVSRGVVPSAAASGDEIGQFASAFGALAQQTAGLREQLEMQGQRFKRNLDITARIGRETATVYDIDQLLNRALNLISVEYNFYHAQVFLLDDVGKNAVLVYSTGEAGRELLNRQHKLAVGSASVIGVVTGTGQPIVVNDTASPGDIPWRFNPLLPSTRAEMALPLQFGDQIIGALDVQSREAGVFDERELQTFQLLADQIAIAVQNARLLQQTQERVGQIDALNRRLTRAAWEETGLLEGAAYSYDLMHLSEDQGAPTKAVVSAHSAASPVERPIVIRGEVVGTLEAAGHDFSDNDHLLMSAVVERVAQALESARLFEETQNSLAETSTLYQLSRYLNEADSLDDVVQAIIQSVMPEAGGGQILVFEGDSPVYGVFSADWALGGTDRSVSLRGLRIHIPDHPILKEMQANSISLVNELSRDNRMDDFFRALAQDIGAQSMVLIPFSVRGVWRGIILIEFPQPRSFSESEGRLYTALIDQAGITIDNRMLLTENEMALAQIERLYSASRSINLSNSLLDLLNAAHSAVDAQDYEMGLVIFEGDLDENGWSKLLRLAALTQRGQAQDYNEIYEFNLSADSPLLRRDIEIVVDNDEKQPSGLLRLLRAHRQRFAAAFPLFSGSQPIALFLLLSPENIQLSDEDAEVFRALTGQISTVLQNRRLLEQTASALDETRRLYDASRAISGAQDARAVYAAAAANLLSSTNPASRISMLIVGPSPLEPARYYDQQVVWRREKTDGDIESQRIPEELVSFASILKERRDLLLVNDQRRDLKKYPALASLLERNSSLSAVMVPVRTRARWFGAILIENSAAASFDVAYGRFVAAVADQMALALESQQLFAEAQDQAQRALALAEASQFASRIGEQELTEALTEVFQRIGQAADYTTWLLLLADPAHTRLNYILEHISGESRTDLGGQYIDLNSNHLLAQAFRIGQPVAVNDPRAMPEYTGMPDTWFETFGKRLHMPVKVAGEVIGVVVVGRASDMPDLGDNDIELVRTLAAQVAVAVENRRLFSEAQAERTTLFTILETLPAGVLVLDPHTFRPIQANRQAERLLGRPITNEEAFTPEAFNIYRSRTNEFYPDSELPISQAASSGIQAMSDDVSVIREDGSTIALLLNAAPIHDARGHISAIVAAFEDITALRGLENSLQDSLGETITLYESTRALTDADTPSDVLRIAVENLQNGAFTSGFIATLSGKSWYAAGASVVIDATWRANEESTITSMQDMILSADMFAAWRVLASATPLIIEDLSSSDLSEQEINALRNFDMQSVVVLPIRAGNRAIGVVVLGSGLPQKFTERDIRIFRSFSEQASLRIDAARLLQQTERRARQLATNAAISQIASSILELDMLLPQLVEEVKTSFAYDHVQVFLMDDMDKFAVLRASTGDVGQTMLEAGHRLEKGSQSVIGQVTAQGKPVIASDITDSRIAHRPNPLLPYIRSEMALPLLLKGQVVGALDVQSAQANAFDEDDVAVLTTLSAQIAVAIENAQLFDESRQRASEMGFLFTVTTAAAAAENLDDALVNVAVELRSSLDVLSVILYRPERYMDAEENTLTILRPVALAGSDQPLSELSEFNLDTDQNAIAEVARSGQPINLSDLNDERNYLPVSEGARSAIIVPLYAGAELIGVIVAEDEEPSAFDYGTLTLLLTLSGTLSAIVQSQQLLEQLQRTNAQLRELDRLKSDFLANMSHELRTPLNSIIGFSKVILKGIDGPLTEMQEQDLSTIYSSGVHLLNLINDILDQAKISAGKMDLQSEYFDMKNVVDAVRSIGIGLVKDKAINIIVDIAPGMPKVYGDEFRTRQVMLNLVSNAAKFTREGGITIRVYLVRDPEAGTYMVRTDVIDTGIGIAEQDLSLLFEAFRQVDSSLTRTVGGTGLGLPIAKSLVNMMGGEILVESRLNIGSTFSIIMPTQPPEGELPPLDDDVPVLDITDTQRFKRGRDTQETSAVSDGDSIDDTSRFPQPARSRDTLETSAMPPMMPPVMTMKRQILLIEDNPDMVDQFRRALQREGYEVFAASIPLEAEAMASGLHPTLIVLSASFGDGAGWDILSRLRSRDDTVDIPIVLVSLNDDLQRASEIGAFAFVRRPFMPEVLVKAVAEAERDSRTQRILIIDDNPESVRLLQELLLEQKKYRIFTAATGIEGISMVARRRPDLVLLDLRMPEMDGFSVIRELRANPETANIPILVVTAETLTAEEQVELTSYSVIYKTDLTNGHRHQLGDQVRNKLERESGV